MEDIRNYRIEEDDSRHNDDDRIELAGPSDDEVPFHIPRD